MLQQVQKIAVHEYRNSETVSSFFMEDRFTKRVRQERENGNLWGCYWTQKGNVAAQLKDGTILYNVLR